MGHADGRVMLTVTQGALADSDEWAVWVDSLKERVIAVRLVEALGLC